MFDGLLGNCRQHSIQTALWEITPGKSARVRSRAVRREPTRWQMDRVCWRTNGIQ